MKKQVGYEFNEETVHPIKETVEGLAKKGREVNYIVSSLSSPRPIMSISSTLPKVQGAITCLKFQHFWNLRGVVSIWETLNGRAVDIILIDTDEDPEEGSIETLKSFSTWGVVISDGTLGRVEKYSNYLGTDPSIIMCPINPFKYSPEIIQYAKDRNITLIGTDIYGNEESRAWMIKTFGQQYLEEFALSYTDGVILPTNDVTQLVYSSLYILDHYQEQEEVRPDYRMKDERVWSDKVKPAKRKVKLFGLNTLSDFTLPWDNSYGSGTTISSFKDITSVPENEGIEYLGEDYFIPEYFDEVEARNYAELFAISHLLQTNSGQKANAQIDFKHDLSLLKVYYEWPYSIFKKSKDFIVFYNPITRLPGFINPKKWVKKD